jgi:hypothetical protein
MRGMSRRGFLAGSMASAGSFLMPSGYEGAQQTASAKEYKFFAGEFILANDVSYSIKNDDYALQKEGTRWSLLQPEIMEAILNLQTLRGYYMEFASRAHLLVPSMPLSTEKEILTFANLIVDAGRPEPGDIGNESYVDEALQGIYFTTKANGSSGYMPQKRIIDISTDGFNRERAFHSRNWRNNVTSVDYAWTKISALILPDKEGHATLGDTAAFYRKNVITTDGLLKPVQHIADYGEVMKEKMKEELPQIASLGTFEDVGKEDHFHHRFREFN